MNFIEFYKTKFLKNFKIFSKNVFKLNQINAKIAKNSLNVKVFFEITLTCLYYLLKFFQNFLKNFHKVFLLFFQKFLKSRYNLLKIF